MAITILVCQVDCIKIGCQEVIHDYSGSLWIWQQAI